MKKLRDGLAFGSGLVGTLLAATAAVASPTQIQVYRDDQSGLVVYRDSDDKSVYWFVPSLRALEENGKTKVIRQTKGGRVQYLFYVVPTLSKELAVQVANEIPGIYNLSQLRPVPATKVGMVLPMFSAIATTSGVTDAQYLNQPQLMRLDLNAADAEEFDALYSGSPGVPIQMMLAYTAQTRSKFLEISLSCKDVAQALEIGASGKYTFIGADIANKVSKYLATKSLQIRNQGDISMPEVMSAVVKECFDPTADSAVRGGTKAKPSIQFNPLEPGESRTGEEVAKNDEFQKRAKVEARMRERAAPGEGARLMRQTGPMILRPMGLDFSSGSAEEPTPIDLKAQFTFKRDKISKDNTVFVKREDFVDSQEVATRTTYLTARPSAPPTRIITPIAQKQSRVTIQATAGAPLRTGVYVQPGDSYTINAAFSLAAKSPYGGGTVKNYVWDAAWARPDGDLYFRVGDGPWRSVATRGLIGSNELGTGEIQLYIDRATLWSRIPKEYREPTMLGLVPAVFPYATFYPEFVTSITGRRIQTLRKP